MLNLLRMDLYRMKISKSFYMCLLPLVLTTILSFLLIYTFTNPELVEKMISNGMLVSSGEPEMLMEEFKGLDILGIFKEINIGGGAFALVSGIYAVILICGDFNSGFIKNIISVHEKKQDYVISKIICLGIQNFIYLIVTFVLTILLNLVTGNIFSYVSISEALTFGVTAWVLITALSALAMMLCIWTRNEGIGIAAAICLGGGIVVQLLYSVLSIFGANGFLEHTLYMNLKKCPVSFQEPGSLGVLVTGVVFLIIYTGISILIMRKKDV